MWTLIALLIIAWLLALLTSVTAGGWAHGLAVVAALLAVVKVAKFRARQMG